MSRSTEKADDLSRALRAALPSASAYVLALSGGADSTAVLHLLHGRLPLRCLHVNHGLGPQAAALEAAAISACAQLGLPLRVLRIAQSPPQSNIEDWARTQRYALLRSALRAGEVLMTAHHREDQVETFLLAAARGSGPQGLRGLLPLQAFGPGWLARPALGLKKADLRPHAGPEGEAWVEDQSNADGRFDRNRLRADVLPTLVRWRPAALVGLADAASHQAQLLEGWQALAGAYVRSLQGPSPYSWQLPPLLALPDTALQPLLRLICVQAGAPPPPARMLSQLRSELGEARADAEPQLRWRNWSLRRHRGLLHLLPPLPKRPPEEGLPLRSRRGQRSWPGGGQVRWEAPVEEGLQLRSGVMAARVGAGAGVRVDEAFRQLGVPPWVRLRWPQLWAEGSLRAIAGWGFAAADSGWVLHWEQPPPWARYWLEQAAAEAFR